MLLTPAVLDEEPVDEQVGRLTGTSPSAVRISGNVQPHPPSAVAVRMAWLGDDSRVNQPDPALSITTSTNREGGATSTPEPEAAALGQEALHGDAG